MSSPDDDTEKSHEPSQKKLDDARKKGEIPKSNDMSTAAGYLGLLIFVFLFSAPVLTNLGTQLTGLLANAGTPENIGSHNNGSILIGKSLVHLGIPTLPILIVPGIFVLAQITALRGFSLAPSKLTAKLSRISPLSNAKNKFGRSGLFEFFKSFVKLLVYSACMSYFIQAHLDEMTNGMRLEPGQIVVMLGRLCTKFLIFIVVISTFIGVFDLLWQHFEHVRKNRMSHQEMRDEHKEAEGDPGMKQQRRSRAQEIAMNHMLAEVPSADVVIVNPTHYAVALRWDRMENTAPVCVAKGVDEIAARIKEIALNAAVPVHADPPTARALFAYTDLGQPVSPEYYGPVAAAIRFSEEMRTRAKQRGDIGKS